MLLRLPARTITFPRRPLILGILALRPGALDHALATAATHLRDGADGLHLHAAPDPGISAQEETRLLLGLLDLLRPLVATLLTQPGADPQQISPPILSLAATHPATLNAVAAVATEILSPAAPLPLADAARACLAHGLALLITAPPHLLAEKIHLATAAGLPREQILLNPAIGPDASAPENLHTLRHARHLHTHQLPILLDTPPRDPDAIAVIAAAHHSGAHLIRVHHVRPAFQSVKMLHALPSASPSEL